MFKKMRKLFEIYWKCKCGATIADDRNFCMYCDRERPIGS